MFTDRPIWKRIALSLPILLVKRLKSLLDSTMDQVYTLFSSKAKNNPSTCITLLALCMVARVLEQLAVLCLEGIVPDVLVRTR